MAKKLELQIAIQGGGAKILSLLAVLEIVEEYESAGKIKVKRIAGTSAGAIAGAIFASRVGVKDVLMKWVSPKMDELITSFKLPRGLTLLYRAMSNTPLWSEKPLRSFLRGIFSEKKLTYFKDFVDIEVIAVATNIRDGKPVKSGPDDGIVDKLMDSAGLPFLFRKWRASAEPIFLDGGIGDNLPAQFLDKTDKAPLPVAISFAPSQSERENPSTLADFCLRLLGTAIDASTTKSQASVSSTHFIETKCDTFDFPNAREILASEMSTIQKRAREWINGLIEYAENLEHKADAETFHIQNHPWLADDFHAREGMKKIWSVVNSHHTDVFNFHKVSLRIQLNCLGADADCSDNLTYDVIFDTEHGTSCFWLGTTDGVGVTLTAASELGVWALDVDGTVKSQVKFIPIPAIESERPTDTNIVLFFTPPLPPGRYLLQHREVGTGLMTRLLNNQVDELSISPARVNGKINTVRLIIDHPSSVKKIFVKPQPTNSADSFKLLEGQALEIATLEEKKVVGFNTIIFEGHGVTPKFGIDIEMFR